jgi:hypothetical protein
LVHGAVKFKTPIFLDPDGNFNPATELRKTLEAQLSPVESIPILMFD